MGRGADHFKNRWSICTAGNIKPSCHLHRFKVRIRKGNVNTRAFFGRSWGGSLEVVGGGRGRPLSGGGREGLEELRGGGVLPWVSPTAGTSVFLRAPAGEAVRLGRRHLLRRGRGVRSVGGGHVGIRRGVHRKLVFLLVLLPSPEGPAAERICRWKKPKILNVLQVLSFRALPSCLSLLSASGINGRNCGQ